MKAQLRTTPPNFGSSFSIRRIEKEALTEESGWHFHNEFELIYLSDGSGRRHIGNHISKYQGGDLILLGPNIPHFAFTQSRPDDQVKVVVQMKADFLGTVFLTKPELQDIRRMLDRSKNGILFGKSVRDVIGEKLEALADVNPFQKLIGLLEVLQELATTEAYGLMNVNGFMMEARPQDETRINQIFKYVKNNYQEPISLDDIAREVSMTVPSFCRFFKKLTHLTFTQFVNEYRVHQACKLLQQEDMLVIDISESCGFSTLSHFNKQFLKITGLTPTAYKQDNQPLLEMSIP